MMDSKLEAVLRDAAEHRCRPNIDDIDCMNILFEIDRLRAQLAECQKERDDYRAMWLARLKETNDWGWGEMSDTLRLTWLERNPHHAQILVDGQTTDCVFYGISCAELVKLRDAIDAAMKGELG